ncbi:MAG TPA: aminoglycoside phosphotransferase [Acidobacteria bacterium]|nr:aminoglycoside phosphotransferase [Acidobacteriota bacterium]
MSKRARFLAKHPDRFFMDADNRSELLNYLRKLGWLSTKEVILDVETPGDGNMNYLLRLQTSVRTVILKQARPWVEKYDQIDAPSDRALVEAAFYTAIKAYPALEGQMPKLLALDPSARMLMLEDLGTGNDYTNIYQDATLAESDLIQMVQYLSALHKVQVSRPSEFTNPVMRRLNHLHIFVLPLQRENTNNLDAITPGLEKEALRVQQQRRYVDSVTSLGDFYLQDGKTLIHGDFFPGSWLRTSRGPKIIDPEFCFLGFSEFDLGILIAHLFLGQDTQSLVGLALDQYAEQSTRCLTTAQKCKILQFAGVEIMRRIIGVAQLPLICSLEQKRVFLAQSTELVLSPSSLKQL